MAKLVEDLERFAENHAPCMVCEPSPDGGPVLRPHSIQGWWQMWSVGTCIYLFRPEDVAPILASARKP
jgi:hypothetical protein